MNTLKEFKYVRELIEERLLELRKILPDVTEEVKKLRDEVFTLEDRLRMIREEHDGLERFLSTANASIEWMNG